MRIFEGKKWATCAVGILAIALVSAACTGDDDDDSAGELVSGTYLFTVAEIPIDQCWPSDTNANPPILGAAIPLTVTVLNSTGFNFSVTGTAGTFLSPEIQTGTYEGEDVGSQLGTPGQAYEIPVHLTSSCTLTRGANMSGKIEDDGSLDLTFYTALTVAALNSAGTAVADCTVHPAELFDGFVPFPEVLAVPHSGNGPSCGVSVAGVATAP